MQNMRMDTIESQHKDMKLQNEKFLQKIDTVTSLLRMNI